MWREKQLTFAGYLAKSGEIQHVEVSAVAATFGPGIVSRDCPAAPAVVPDRHRRPPTDALPRPV